MEARMSQPEVGAEVGQQAPDFTLPYSRTEAATLSDYRGKKKVMLAFYVLDFTGG
jgi:peroxiredoxin